MLLHRAPTSAGLLVPPQAVAGHTHAGPAAGRSGQAQLGAVSIVFATHVTTWEQHLGFATVAGRGTTTGVQGAETAFPTLLHSHIVDLHVHYREGVIPQDLPAASIFLVACSNLSFDLVSPPQFTSYTNRL